MGLMDEMRRVADEVRRKREFATNEDNTRSYLVEPFIAVLGYDAREPDDVEQQFTADIGKNNEKVDLVLKKDGKRIILIEIKKAETNLSKNDGSQLRRYYGAKPEIPFGIFTNGFEYRFYADLDNTNIMDKQPFLIIDMLNLDERLVKELEGFTKANFDAERILSSAKELKLAPEIRRRLAKEYQQPSRDLVRLLANGLYSGSFKQSVFEEFAPIVRKAFHEFVDDKIASRPPTGVQSESSPAETEAQIAVEASPIQPVSEDGVEIPVFAEYEGHRFEATLLLTSKHKDVLGNSAKIIRYGGQMLTPLAAAWKTRISVNPDAAYASGMRYWRFINPESNEECPIVDLRDDEGLRRRMLGMD